jgi:hypothetical protein
MTRSSIYEDEQYEIYEAHYEQITGLTGTTVTIGVSPSIDAHADSIATASADACKRTVVYINGVSDIITAVADNAVDGIDITITTTLVASDVVDVYVASATGTLPSNAATGKLTLPELQNMQAYGATGNQIARPGCGTKTKSTIIFSAEGTITLGLDRRGNTALKDFSEAMDEDTYLLIAVKDTTEGATGSDVVYDLLREARVTGYGRSAQAVETERGIITDTVTFAFQPPVKYITGV